jgi:UBX domain-containing protein 6
MDKLKEKLKKGLSLGSSGSSSGSILGSKPKAFQGTPHRLGSGNQPIAQDSSAIPPQRGSRSTGHASSSSPALSSPRQTHIRLPTPTTDVTSPPQPARAHLFPHASASIAQPQASEEIELAVAQLSAEPRGRDAAAVLSRLLSNIVNQPEDPKYRKVRLSNQKIRDNVVEVSGGIELLMACGFAIVFTTIPTAAAAAAPGSEKPTADTTNDKEGTLQEGMSAATTHSIESDDARPKQEGHPAGATSAVEVEVSVPPTTPLQTEEVGMLVLHEDAELTPLKQALALLRPLSPPTPLPRPGSSSTSRSTVDRIAAGVAQVGAASATTARNTAPSSRQREFDAPCERDTRVLLPRSVEAEVPDWFFQRSGAELKATFLSALRRREESQVLTTRAMRERRAGAVSSGGSGAGASPATLHAAIKVRLPEGLAVQGMFRHKEPVAAVFAWFASCLRDPMHTFDLVLPDRTALEFGQPGRSDGMSTLVEAGLVPSVTLLLRWTGPSAAAMREVPALRDDLMATAT